MDHLNARIARFSFEDAEVISVESTSPTRQIHRKSGPQGAGRLPDDHHFFDEIVAATADTREVLIAGPGTAKTAFKTYVDKKHHTMTDKIVGVETVDHPSDGELLAYARKYFKRVDNLRGI
jgi:stalled ribosome rescue protein Dom34